MSGNLGNTKTSKWTVSQLAGMQGITDDEYIAKQKEENRKKYLAQFAGIDGFGSADTRYMSYPLSRSAQENTGKIKRYLIEVKPLKQTTKPKKPKRQTKGYIREAFEYARNQAKWKAAREYCADRMWEFKVITEKELDI